MGKKLYVGNLSYNTSDSELQKMFEEYGTVQSAQVIMDRDTGRQKASASSRWAAMKTLKLPSTA